MALRTYQGEACRATFQALMRSVATTIVVMATGTGKSVVIAELLKGLARFPKVRAIMLVHVKELVEQNHKALVRMWPEGIHDIGIYHAAIGRRDTQKRIIMAGIHSVYKKAEAFGFRTHVFVDEAHLIPSAGEGMYNTFLEGLRRINPDIQLVKFTATPYRTDTGTIPGETVYEYGIAEGIEDGWLAPLLSKRTVLKYDVSKVKKAGGEFVEKDLQEVIDQQDVTDKAVSETLEFAEKYNRKHGLVFCTGVDHAIHVRDALRAAGKTAETVTGETDKGERERIIEAFRDGRIDYLTNANVLTTGFDAPCVDLIAFMRPTLSTGLYVQMIGRGTRPVWGDFVPDEHTAEERKQYIATCVKPNALVLDFAGNIRRHGPVDMIEINAKARAAAGKKEGTTDEKTVLAKDCPNPDCDALLRLDCFECPDCGYAWEPPKKEAPIQSEADGHSAVLSNEITAEWHEVRERFFARNYGKIDEKGVQKKDTLRVEYQVSYNMKYSEWICFAHDPFSRPRRSAEKWWRAMGGDDENMPDEIPFGDDCARLLAAVQAVQVRKDGKFWRIARYRVQGRDGARWEVDENWNVHPAGDWDEEEVVRGKTVSEACDDVLDVLRPGRIGADAIDDEIPY